MQAVMRVAAADRSIPVLIRLAALALAGVAVVSSAGVEVAALGVAYLAWIALAAWLPGRIPMWAWGYIEPAIDVAAISALVVLVASPAVPLWPLYLFPLVAATTAGPRPAGAALVLATGGFLAARWVQAGQLAAPDLWTVLFFGAAALVGALFFARSRDERRERRAWLEAASAGRELMSAEGRGAVGQLAVERARRLARAEHAWLWRWDTKTVSFQAAAATEGEATPALDSTLRERIERGPLPLDEAGPGFQGMTGEIVPVGEPEVRAALGVGWRGTSSGVQARLARVRALSSWLADALERAEGVETLHESLRWERALARAAATMAATLDPELVRRAALEAAQGALAGRAWFLEESVPQVPGTAHTVAVEGGLHLVLERQGEPPGEAEERWLGRLAGVTRTALRRCEIHSRLRSDEDRLRATIEATPEPMALRDSAGRVTVANEAYRAAGLRDRGPLPPDPTGMVEAEVQAGDRAYIALTAPVANGIAFVSVYHDVTREREALQAKDMLIAMIGHELRTPLTSIHGYSQMMGKQLRVVQEQVDQLNQLIGDFVDASRLEGGRLPVEREQVDLADVAQAAAERFGGAHQGRRLRLELTGMAPMRGDRARLEQVVDNLLSNAVKYSPEDSEIVLETRVEGGEVELAVHDRGIGIAREHLPHLFERYYRVPGERTRRIHGLGLGLSIVHDLVAAHGGRVWAESEGEDRGSTFRVRFPASVVEANEMAQPAAAIRAQ